VTVRVLLLRDQAMKFVGRSELSGLFYCLLNHNRALMQRSDGDGNLLKSLCRIDDGNNLFHVSVFALLDGD
jgi:hypothetical protein